LNEIKIKHRRGELTLTPKDVILFNGACYQLVTQTYFKGWYNHSYILSKTACEKLIKQKKLVMFKKDEGDFKSEYYKIAVN
jgi:hypothetical protein